MALAVAEPSGDPADTVAFDDAVGDQPHRSGDDVVADVPVGRAGRGIGMTSLARTEAAVLRRRRRVVELDVRPFRRDRRTTRAAVDARRAHRHDEPTVEAGVAARCSGVTEVGVEWWHDLIIADTRRPDQRKSDSGVATSEIR